MAKSKKHQPDKQPQGSRQSGQALQDNQQQAARQGGRQPGAMGENRGSRQGGDEPAREEVDPGYDPQAGNLGSEETSEVQQSAQREGMGSHRHSNRGNEQALDAAADVDDLGNHIKGAANSRADKPGS